MNPPATPPGPGQPRSPSPDSAGTADPVPAAAAGEAAPLSPRWLLDVFLRPGRALGGSALAMGGGAAFVLMWVMGMAGAVDRFDLQLALDRAVPYGESWGMYWGLVAVG